MICQARKPAPKRAGYVSPLVQLLGGVWMVVVITSAVAIPTFSSKLLPFGESHNARDNDHGDDQTAYAILLNPRRNSRITEFLGLQIIGRRIPPREVPAGHR